MRPTASVIFSSIIWYQMLGINKFCCAVSVEKYQLFDKLGLPSSFLYEGGTLEITCSNDGNDEVTLKQLGKPNKVIAKGKGKVFKELNLEVGLIDEVFKCFPEINFDAKFKIKKFMCDPYELVPKIDSCKDDEVCVIKRDNTAVCEALTDEHCFLQDYVDATRPKYASSLPKLPYVCGESTDSEVYYYGLCHAKVKKLNEIVGQASSNGDCFSSYKILLNGKQIEMNGLTAENGKYMAINLTIEGSVKYDKMKCRLISSTNETITENEAPDTQPSMQLTLAASLDLTAPSKSLLVCNGQFRATNTISTFSYILLYDPSTPTFHPSMQAQVIKPGESISLECRCNAPEGLFCSLSWEKLTDVPEISKIIKKTVLMKEHLQGAVTQNCFSSIYVIGYPASYKMVELMETRKTSPKILKEEDFKKPEGTTENKNSSAPDDANASDKKSKNSDNASKSSLHPGVIALIVILIILLIIGALVGLVFWKKSKTQQLTKLEPATNVSRTRESMDGKIELTKCQAKKSASVKTKTGSPIQKTDFYKEMLADEGHMLSNSEIDTFFEDMMDAARKSKPSDVKQTTAKLKNTGNLCYDRIESEIEELLSVNIAGKYIATSRNTEVPIKVETFVKHTSELNDAKSDYDSKIPVVALHMNYATNNDGDFRYILSQAPLKAEINQFLRVVWEKKVSLIVTIHSTAERKDEDVVPRDYFPYFFIEKNQTISYGEFSIKCRTCILNNCSDTRQITIESKTGSGSYSVTVVSYHQWTDPVTVDDVKHVVYLSNAIQEFKSTFGNSYISLIHCKEGTGRSGLLVAALNCFDFINRFPADGVNIFRIVEKLRKERIGAIDFSYQLYVLYCSVGEYRQRLFLNAANKALKAAPEKSRMAKSITNKTVIKTASVKGKL